MKKKIIEVGPELFQAFVEKQLAEYKEPQRKGVAKGEPIGMSKKKYEISLAMLTVLPHKVISDSTGVSASLIRKWRTEDVFRKQIEQNERHFAAYVINAILRLNEINLGYLAKYYDRPGKEDYTAIIEVFEKLLPDGSPEEKNTLVVVEPIINLDILTDEVKTEIIKQINNVGTDDFFALYQFRKLVISSLLKERLPKEKDLLLVDLLYLLAASKILYKEITPLLTKADRTPKETEFLENIVGGMSIYVEEMADTILNTLKQDPRVAKALEDIGKKTNE